MAKVPSDKSSASSARQQKLEQISTLSLAHGRKTINSSGSAILAVDCSDSMTEKNKMEQARAGASGFSKEAFQGGYAVGVVSFHSDARNLAAPTRDARAVEAALADLRSGGSTNMAAAIDLAVSLLPAGKNRVICVVTDGMPNSAEETISSARRARDNGIEIMAVGTDDADWGFLTQIVSRKNLAKKVDRQLLSSAVADMAKLLPRLPPSGR